MKTTFKRLMVTLLVLAMILSFVPAVAPQAKAWTTNQQRIADRCDYFYNCTWVCQKTINGWRDEFVFTEGETYRMPYAQPVNSGAFIGYGVTVDEFLRTAADANSVFYSSQSEFNGWTSTYYGTDCAAFVAMCWGVVRQDCTTLWNGFTNLGKVTVENINSILQLGDALDSIEYGHVVLVSDLIYDESGTLVTIEITEQTPPQLKRSYYTPEELAEKYWEEFYIFRYYGSVPEAPVRGYVADCTAYDAYCDITITADTTIMSLPCTADESDESAYIGDVLAGESHTAIKLYKNTADELWYQIKLASGEDAYIRAENTHYVDDILTDIVLEDAQVPTSHVQGTTFSTVGNISASYNRLNTAAVYIYEGFGVSGNAVTGGSGAVTGNAYTLKNSSVDFATSFGDLTTGNHTYTITTDYVNYYVDDNGEVCSNSGTIELLTHYFMVVRSTVSNCSHNYTSTILSSATCVNPGTIVYSCSSCGDVYTETDTASGHNYGDWTVVSDATCEEDGLKTSTCSSCGNVQEEVIPATGHNYTAQSISADCQTIASTKYTCETCGDVYYVFAEELYSDWSEAAPADVDASLIQTKQQYRNADLITVTSGEAVLEGYELVSTGWAKDGTSGTVTYVPEWPNGFEQSHELYAQYNNTPVKASITDSSKTIINSDVVTGYLYYHWCYDNSYYTKPESTGSYTQFHAFYSTVDPSTHDRHDTSDNSYLFENECCANSGWFFVAEVNTQTYTVYDVEYTHGKWGEFSDWSDEVIAESDTCKVETRTLYRYVESGYGDHDWVDGVCSICGTAATTDPTDPVEPTDPTEPEDPGVDPTDPTEPEDPVVDPTDPTEPEDPVVDPTDPTKPEDPVVDPTDPTEPEDPVVDPTDPTEPEDPVVDPTNPTEPEDPIVEPVVTGKTISLSFEDEILLNFYFTAENLVSEDLGMLVFYADPGTADISLADVIYADAIYDAATDRYMSQTTGIPAKEMGDTRYYAAYAKLSDGTYVYSDLYDYSPKKYALSRLEKSTDETMKALCVAMLNYGAAAQTYFEYKTDDLMNATLTVEQQALVQTYSADLFVGAVAADSAKVGNFAKTDTGFSKKTATVSFEGAFAINYYFTPDSDMDGDITFYYWTSDAYAAADTLKTSNATGKMTMVDAGNGSYWAQVTGIAAKQLDDTFYVAAVYTCDNVLCSTGVVAYSLSKYCVNNAVDGSDMQELAAATAIYGYHAKLYFE